MGIKKNISENSFFYKLYLYYNLYIRHKALKKRRTYSQHEEDLFINNYFKDKDKGFYLDVGCYHPIMYSNTTLLHNRGWQGVNIDMNQTSIDLFNILRKKDKNICAAISNKKQETIQYFDHAFSPINSLDKKFSDIASKTISFNDHPKLNCHFDFERRNLIASKANVISVIDFQDLCIGPIGIDLAGILLDHYIVFDESFVKDSLALYKTKSSVDLNTDELFECFRWGGIQRNMRILGTLSKLYMNNNRTFRLNDLPMILDNLINILPNNWSCKNYMLDTIKPRLTEKLASL